MKKILYSLAIVLALTAVSCQEWEPVLGNQGIPAEPASQVLTVNTTIAQLKALYQGKPYHVEKDLVISGKVISSDASGNIYRSLYIQDETGGIELKIGNSALYNDYALGQTLYVKCEGLTVGNYGGMLQIGMEDPTGEYETAYIDVKSIISAHVFKGEKGSPLSPQVISEDELKDALRSSYKSPIFGKLVTLNDLTYGDEIFVLIYIDPNKDKKASSNRLFLSDQQWGVDTWAFSEGLMKKYLSSGVWDSAKIGNSGDYNYGTVRESIGTISANASAYAVSQYFKMPKGTEVQVRTSGYAKFADQKIDPAILRGAKVDLTGILTNYNGAAQFTLIDIDGVKMK